MWPHTCGNQVYTWAAGTYWADEETSCLRNQNIRRRHNKGSQLDYVLRQLNIWY